MNYAYATLLLNESGEEINEKNLTAVLEASGCTVEESRVKAIVAALEDVDLAGVVPADIDEDPTDDAGDHSEERPDDREGSVSGGEEADTSIADEDTESSDIQSGEDLFLES